MLPMLNMTVCGFVSGVSVVLSRASVRFIQTIFGFFSCSRRCECQYGQGP